MTDLLIVLATAALFVVFGLASRHGRACPGSEACAEHETAVGGDPVAGGETLAGCAGCPSLHREDHHGSR
jgi:hypothetical protein